MGNSGKRRGTVPTAMTIAGSDSGGGAVIQADPTPECRGVSQYRDSSNLKARALLHARYSTNRDGWLQWVFRQLDLPSQCRVLELGCGTGELWRSNLDAVPHGWCVILSDLSPGMVSEARQKLLRHEPQFGFCVADAQDIPLPERSFDCVVANHMLYHVADRPRALAEIRRVLKPGALVVAATNGKGHMRELMEVVAKVDPNPSSGPPTAGFTLESGADQLARWFADVRLSRREDSLRITAAEPAVAYALSMGRFDLTGARSRELRRLIENEIGRHGAFMVSKETGIFTARKEGD